MTDIVFTTADYATLLADAERLGYLTADGRILTQGPVTGGGTYFLNYVGAVRVPTGGTSTVTGPFGPVTIPEMSAPPGVWGRLRVNGSLDHLPAFSNAITQYLFVNGVWTSDGVTPAPDYIGSIAVII